MEDLPPAIVVEILGRLRDTTDLASCRLASRSLHSLSYSVRSVRIFCSRSASASSVPFKSLVSNLVSILPDLESLSIGIHWPAILAASTDDGSSEVESDDADHLYLTAAEFLASWLPATAGKLRSLAISDFWIQSCWRKSSALSLISDLCCNNLRHLELRSAWLSVEGLNPMVSLTSLVLEYIKLDDEDLQKVNECFPSLQSLRLIGIGGLREPQLRLPSLRTCFWSVSNYPDTLTIKAPSLVELELLCIEPKILIIDAPMLSRLDISIREPAGRIDVGELRHVRSLRAASADLRCLLRVFGDNHAVRKLELGGIPGVACNRRKALHLSLHDLMSAFPNVDDLRLLPGAWNQLVASLAAAMSSSSQRRLNCLVLCLPPSRNLELVSSLLDFCASQCKVSVFIRDDAPLPTPAAVARLSCDHPEMQWRWGSWKESGGDVHFELSSNTAMQQ